MHVADLRPRTVGPDVLEQAASRDTDEPTVPAGRVAWITLAVLLLLAALA